MWRLWIVVLAFLALGDLAAADGLTPGEAYLLIKHARPMLKEPDGWAADLLDAMQKDWGMAGQTFLRVDGGMAASDWTMQTLADILNAPVERPKVLETTARGAAYLAGLQAGLLPPPSQFAKGWKSEKRFTPKMGASERNGKLAGWRDCIRKLQA